MKENGSLESCFVWDNASSNRTRINDELIKPDTRIEIDLDDQIQFGFVKFSLGRMSESERKEQEVERSHLVVDTLEQIGKANGHTNGHANGNTNGHTNGKASSLFEIQNTLDDTVVVTENGSAEVTVRFTKFKK